MLWPAIAHFRERALADSVDGMMFSWLWGRMTEALAEGRNPYRTELLFHPHGADLAMTTSVPLVGLLTWPVRAALGPAAQVNVVQLVSMFTAALAAYFLILRICRHHGVAFVSGAAYALLPRRLIHVHGQLNLIETGLVPLGLLLFLRFVERPTAGRAAALGTSVGVTFLVDPQLTMLLVLGLGVLAAVHRSALRGALRPLFGAAVAAAVVASPLLVPMAVAIGTGGVAEPQSTSSTLVYSSSPFSWVLPPLDWTWLGRFANYEQVTPTGEGVSYCGLLMLGLAFAGVTVSSREHRRGWVAMAGIGFVLSLGPYLFAWGDYLPLPLPFFLVRAIPGLDAMRVPGRFGLLGGLGLLVLAAIALADLARRHPRRAPMLISAVGVLTLIELFPAPLSQRDETVPAAYAAVVDDPGQGAVLEIPVKWSTTQAQIGFASTDQDFRFLLYQQAHGRPIVSGAVSRFPDEDLDALAREPVYRQLLAMADEPDYDDRAAFTVDDLRALDIGFVAYHRSDPVPQALRYLRDLELDVIGDDGDVIIFKVPAAGG